MKKWYELNGVDKCHLVYKCYSEMNFNNIVIDIDFNSDTPDGLGRDGVVNIIMQHNGYAEGDTMTFRGVHEGNIDYIKHVLRTTAIRLAKKYFSIRAIDESKTN